jgi:outer membrane lipoprotein-sorting protein
MINRLRCLVLVLAAGVVQVPAIQAQETPPVGPTGDAAIPTAEDLFKKAEESVKQYQDYAGTFTKNELFGKELQKHVIQFKFAAPFKVYGKYTEALAGRELMFVRGWNDNEVKAHKGSFPDLTVNLNPEGGMAMEGNHHAITDFGLENMIRISAKNTLRALQKGEGSVKVSDGGTLNGQAVWKVEASYPKGGYNVTAKDDETLFHIARRTGQDMYVIKHYNPKYEDPDDVSEGDQVFIPNYYAGKSEYYFAKDNFMLIKVVSWDHNGRLYETYEFTNLKFNVGLTSQDFNPDNKSYNF